MFQYGCRLFDDAVDVMLALHVPHEEHVCVFVDHQLAVNVAADTPHLALSCVSVHHPQDAGVLDVGRLCWLW